MPSSLLLHSWPPLSVPVMKDSMMCPGTATNVIKDLKLVLILLVQLVAMLNQFKDLNLMGLPHCVLATNG